MYVFRPTNNRPTHKRKIDGVEGRLIKVPSGRRSRKKSLNPADFERINLFIEIEDEEIDDDSSEELDPVVEPIVDPVVEPVVEPPAPSEEEIEDAIEEEIENKIEEIEEKIKTLEEKVVAKPKSSPKIKLTPKSK